ncbi:universal stress protein [Hymenobacter jejuensis]|uniref:Universal stress protein n=1 Tax=Hymenobacter jejuensis TaxID=2502781 RepID=A0A5B7ZV15_9BACT|nr:universal stress protein [Hymenobacter jejuensis]QDA59044.1 universal stress protein [Hymenobacter jejuensis]
MASLQVFNVLTDFSVTSANALQYAMVLAKHVKARINLIHVIPSAAERGVGSVWTMSTPAPTPAQATDMLQILARQVEQQVPCTYEVLYGAAAPSLPQLLEHTGNSVTVVGNAFPQKPTAATTSSSVALHLIRMVQQPLLVVPLTYSYRGLPRRVVLDTDRLPVRLPHSARLVPELLAQLVSNSEPMLLSEAPGDVDQLLSRLIPAVVGIHVYTSEHSPLMAEVADEIQNMGLLEGVAHTVSTSRYPCIEQGIRYAAAREGADMLSFVARQKTYSDALFYTSVTARLIASSRIPVLTCPEA